MICTLIATALAVAGAAQAAPPRAAPPTTLPAATSMAPRPHVATSTTLGPSHATGQPNAHCGDPGTATPGQSAGASGSAFNPDGKAGTVYAGTQPQNSKNAVSVSQYDVACTHQPAH